MSYRLHIGKTSDPVYDLVLESVADAKIKLREGLSQDFLKIFVGDLPLYREVEPFLIRAFDDCGEEFPDSVMAFYYRELSVEHPSRDELHAMLGFK